jgi:hypothetical protein
MIGQMRGKIGGYIVVAIVGFIALVFAFEGVFGPKATRGLHEGSVAGEVNGEPIHVGDFNRAVERKLEFVKGLMGGKVTEEQMKMFRIREGVFQELVQQKLMSQAAIDSGRTPSAEAIRHEIMGLPYFQKDGKFDLGQYRGVLEANRYNPATFEKMIGEQLAVEEWQKSYASQVRVSEAEVKDEFLSSKNTRSYKYVSIPADMPAAEEKGPDGKPLPVKAAPALTPKAAADKVAAMIKADSKSDAAINALLKPFGASVREAKDVSANAEFIAGAQEAPDLKRDLFAENGPLAPGKTKVYEGVGRILVVHVVDAKKPDLAKLEASREDLLRSIRSRKERELMNAVMKKLQDKAKIVTNPSIVSSGPTDQA